MRGRATTRAVTMIALAMIGTILMTAGTARPAAALDGTYVCTGVGDDIFASFIAGPDVVELTVTDDPDDLAGPNSDLIVGMESGGVTHTWSYSGCTTMFITTGVGDETLTVKGLDPATTIDTAILLGSDWDTGGNVAIDELGDDTIIVEATVPPIELQLHGFSGDDLLSVAPTFGGFVSIGTGGPGNDRMLGGAGNDVFHGNTGNDTIKSRGGNDEVFGNEGNDNINLGGGADRGIGDAGDDTIRGGGGPDDLFGGPGNDRLLGQGAKDDLFGDVGDDTLDGGNGADILAGAAGKDVVRGQTGPDQLHGGEGDDLLAGGNGNDSLVGNEGVDKCAGNLGGNDLAHSTCETFPGVEGFF